MKIMYKLMGSFSLIIVIFLCSALIINAQLGVMNDQDKNVKMQVSLNGEVNSYLSSARQLQNGIYLYVQGSTDIGNQMINAGMAGMSSSLSALQNNASDPALISDVSEIGIVGTTVLQDKADILTIYNGQASDKVVLLTQATSKLNAQLDALNLRISSMVETSNENVQMALDNAAAVSSSTTNTVLMLVALAIAISLALAIWTSMRITRPLVSLTEAADGVSLGNLDHQVTVTTKDEESRTCSASFQRMINAFKVMRALEESADEETEGSK